MLKTITPEDCLAIAKIHISALEGDFLPSLGAPFLKAFYKGIIGKPGIYGFAVFEKGGIRGFVVGTNDSGKFFSTALHSNFIKLSLLLLVQILKKPFLIKNVMETFLYPEKDVGVKAELIVIAVEKKYQGKGFGKQLTRALESAFKKNGIRRYKLTVHADKEAVGFYEHLGYSRISQFSLYGKMWFVYEKEVGLLHHTS